MSSNRQAKNIIPPIGYPGIFKLRDPFNTLIVPDVIYTCQAVRRIEDLIASGMDPYNEFYYKHKLTPDMYKNDLLLGVCIITLQSVGGGSVVYVPSTYIESYPQAGGVSYTVLGLAVDLGALPDTTNLSLLTDKVKSVVQNTIGVIPEIKPVAISASTLVPHLEHDTLERSRLLNIENSQTDYAKVLRLESQNQSLVQKVQELEKYIKDNL